MIIKRLVCKMALAIALHIGKKSSLGKLNTFCCHFLQFSVAVRSDRIISLIYVITTCDINVVECGVSYKSISINRSIDFGP